MFGPAFEARVRRISMWVMRPMAESRITPNMLTVVGLLLNIVTAVVIGGGWLFASGVLLLFAGVFDMADGALACVNNLTSDGGDFLDATLDRLAEGSIGLGLLWQVIARYEDLVGGLDYALYYCAVLTSSGNASLFAGSGPTLCAAVALPPTILPAPHLPCHHDLPHSQRCAGIDDDHHLAASRVRIRAENRPRPRPLIHQSRHALREHAASIRCIPVVMSGWHPALP